MVPESATAVVSGQLPDLVGLLDAFAKGTPAWRMKFQLLTKKPIPLPLLGNLLTDQLLKMELMVRPTWLSC